MEGPTSLSVRESIGALTTSADSTQILAASKTCVSLLAVDEGTGELSETVRMAPGKNRSRKKDVTCNDVDWCHARPEVFAAGAVTGAVAVLRVGDEKMGRRTMFHHHKRFVNRVQWNGELLLSGSQDGVAALWDTRVPAESACVATFSTKTGPVHDLSWEPGPPGDTARKFVVGTTNNMAAVWDLRSRGKRPVHTIFAHSDLVLSVHWHPTVASRLVTGGRDKLIKIWEPESDTKSPVLTLQSPSPVARVRWHPDLPHLVASCSNTTDLNIHVWSARTPHVPVATFSGHSDQLTSFQWCDPVCVDTPAMLSAARDSSLVLYPYGRAKFPYETLPPSSLAFSANASASLAFSHAFIDRSIGTPAALYSGEPSGEPGIHSKAGRPVHIGSGLDGGFDPHVFKYLAEHYKLSGASVSEMCEANAEAARLQSRDDVATTWDILRLLYGDEAGPWTESEQDEARAAPYTRAAAPALLRDTALSPDDDSYDESGFRVDMAEGGAALGARNFLGAEAVSHPNARMMSLGSGGFILGGLQGPGAARGQAAAAAAAASASASASAPATATATMSAAAAVPHWDHSDTVLEVLDHYAGIGDVQTCVAIAMVLGSKLELEQERIQRYFFAYIELLQRQKLWLAITEVVRECADPEVSALNQKDTMVRVSCSQCGGEATGWFCAACEAPKTCSLCGLPTKGAITWCQGCGHGGHPEHMREWFATSTQCPAGCGHECSLPFV